MELKEKAILERCKKYLLEEPNRAYREQVEVLMNQANHEGFGELNDRMENLRFGTAGLRGKMEAGYNRMNLVSIYRFSYALAFELHSFEKHVVIGFDGRENSQIFADEASLILRSLSVRVDIFDISMPTPLCAFAAKYFNADFGIMITASHNPLYDNGIKVFLASSAQGYGPLLKRIEANMAHAPLRSQWISSIDANILAEYRIGDEIVDAYLHAISQTKFFPHAKVKRDVEVIYTPLHGVGKNLFLRALAEEEFDKITVVPEQSEPDGAFPTVDFPNPEEIHTLDLAHELAIKMKCSWVFANDPDADRLQVSCLDSSGQMKKLSGNEMGSILGYFTLLSAHEKNIKPLVASSIVSSRMLKSMCDQMDAHYVEALTGFSNIVNAAIQLESTSGHQFVFGYEEAIGFLVGQVVLDKDGIHAGVRFMEIAGYLKNLGKSVWQLLDELYVKFGIFVDTSWSWRFDGINSMSRMADAMGIVRSIDPIKVANLLDQSESKKFDLLIEQGAGLYQGMHADVVIFEMENQGRLIVRPSGTEPKIKFYLELFGQATDQRMLSNKRSKLCEKIVELKSSIECLFGKHEA